MEVRIKFSADVYIKGDNMAEIREKFENMPLFSAEALEEGSAEYCETLLIEDADTYDDLSHEYYNDTYTCPECGHVFKQGESDYNYTTGHTDFVCPECDWEGNELEVIMK
jgi:rubrerythrin